MLMTVDFQDVVVSEVIPSDVRLNEIADSGVPVSNNNSSQRDSIVNSVPGSVRSCVPSVLNDFRSEAGEEIECNAALYANSCTKPISACVDNGVEEPDSNVCLHFVAGSSTLPVSIEGHNFYCLIDSGTDDKVKFRDSFVKYHDVFALSDSELGRTSLVQHVIDTGDTTPIKQMPYRTSPKVSKRLIDK